MVARLPDWAREETWQLTLDGQFQLKVSKANAESWFENRYREAKFTEALSLAAGHIGPLTQDGDSSVCLTTDERHVYIMFSTLDAITLYPKVYRLEAAARPVGTSLSARPTSIAGPPASGSSPHLTSWPPFMRRDYAPTIARNSAYNLALVIGETQDLLRQIAWDIRPYRKEANVPA